ncbi:MAG: response regulator [bacterium]
MAGEKVLLVEDQPLNRELATDLLEIAGFTVCQAESGERAIQVARAESPGIILMDISLPGMDGLAATRILRADPRFRSVPIVALTAHAMKGDEDRALNAGCDGYITKPIETASFAQRVTEILARGRPA